MGEALNSRSQSASLRSTPTTKAAPARASLRPPIFNPYDRFTQPEFDAWIGDLTEALRHALRHEPEPDADYPSRPNNSWKTIPDQRGGGLTADRLAKSPTFTEGHDEESTLEDSFAQIASRKAKGKARDPREGPGLGLKDQPIELLSDSEEEEVVDSLGRDDVFLENSDESSEESSGGETEYADSELAEGQEESPGQPGTSTQHIDSFVSHKDANRDQEAIESSDAEACDTSDEGGQQSPDRMGTLRKDYRNGDKASLMQEGREGIEDELPIPSQPAVSFDVELTDPWDGPRTFAEDYYSGGDQLASGLTPNHLTPVARTPVPALVPDLPAVPHADIDEDGLSITSGVLSASLSPSLRETVGADKIIQSLQHSTFISPPLNDEGGIDELTDVTVRAIEDTGHDVDVTEAKRIDKEAHTSYLTRSDTRAKGHSSDPRHTIIWVPPSDDEHIDADGEDDEGAFIGVAPLGTSDLDIVDDWGTSDGHKVINEISEEEDELQEAVSGPLADDVAMTAAFTLSHFSGTEYPSGLNGPEAALVDRPTPTLASTFQLTDGDSFGDLPVSSPPSETPSPVPGERRIDKYELQRHSIEQLFANLEREAHEEPIQAMSKLPTSHAGLSAAEPANAWASQELENILSGEISVDNNAAGFSGPIQREDVISQASTCSAQHLEYIVEESNFETDALLQADDCDDALSVPPPDLTEVVEMIQQYEVEEPKTDGRLTEEPEITANMANESGSAPDPQLILSYTTATNTNLDVSSVQQTERPSYSSEAPAGDLPKAGLSDPAPTIPAPIVADPSFPDPVPGESSPASPITINSPDASGISIIPLSFQKLYDLDVPQLSPGTSGLFTPAQRSDGGTPVLLEDETPDAPTSLRNYADKSPATPSTPLQIHAEPSSPKCPIVVEEDDGDDEKGHVAWVDNFIEPSESASHNEHHLVTEAVAADREPAVDAVEVGDDSSTLIDNSSKESPEHPGVLAVSGEHLPEFPKTVEDDEDADGEADPDYSPVDGVLEEDNLNNVHQPADEAEVVACEKVGNDILEESETLPKSVSVREELKVEILGPPDDASAKPQNDPSSGSFDGQDQVEHTDTRSDVKPSNGDEHTVQSLKRKRRNLNPRCTRITRSKSGVGATREGKSRTSSSGRTTTTSEKANSERVGASVDGDPVNDDASEIASVSSATSVVYRLLRPTSRATSVASSASGDVAPWASPSSGFAKVIPLVHSHRSLHHHHDLHAPPSSTSTSSSSGPQQDSRPGQAKAKSPTPTSEPSTPSLRRAPSTNSPVTRSNCRFHKISLPRGDNGVRAYFVVPGCALGDGELMKGEDIKDEGFSTHDDHKCMLPNVETLDLSSYLVGVLRQLVGVDLLREQQEIFYLPSKEEKLRKRDQRGAMETLRQFQRQSLSSGGPLARELSPRPSEADASQIRATPSRSVSGSAVSSSTREQDVDHNEDSALSDLEGNDDPDTEPPTKRQKSFALEIGPPPADTLTDGEPNTSAIPKHSPLGGKEPTVSRRPPATRKGKRKTLSHDAAAYKPSEDDVQDEEVEDTQKRRSSTRKATKRSRTTEGAPTNPPRPKKMRLSKSVSVAGANAMDS